MIINVLNVPTTRKVGKYVNEIWDYMFENRPHLFKKCADLLAGESDWTKIVGDSDLKELMKIRVIISLATVLNGVVGCSAHINNLEDSRRPTGVPPREARCPLWGDYAVSRRFKWLNFFSGSRQVVHVVSYSNYRITDLDFRNLLINVATCIRNKYIKTIYNAWYWDYILYYLKEIGNRVIILRSMESSDLFERTIKGRLIVCTSLGLSTYQKHKMNNIRSLLSRSCVFVSNKASLNLGFPIRMLNLVDTGVVTQDTLEKTIEESKDAGMLRGLLDLAYTLDSPKELRKIFDGVYSHDHKALLLVLHMASTDSSSLVVMYSANVIRVESSPRP